MRVALLQTSPSPFPDPKTFQQAFSFLKKAREGGADLAILPEVWPTSFGSDLPHDSQWKLWEDLLMRWQETVARYKIPTIGGFLRREEENFYNTLYLLEKDGEIVAFYDKIHLFSYEGEQKRFLPGREPVVFKFHSFHLGLTICYDLRFPELYRVLRQKGMDVGIVIAQWPASRGDHFHLFLRARAVENLSYMIGVNRTGKGGKRGGITFSGGSSVIHPWGDPLWVSGEHSSVSFCEIREEEIQRCRESFPSWEDRRWDLLFPSLKK